MTAVPLPGVSRFTGQEVSRPLVLHPLRKPQQNSGVIVLRVGRGPGGGEERGDEERRGNKDRRESKANFNSFKTLNQAGPEINQM